MSLKNCRACKRQVDTSADFCPGCGATRPAHALSRQQKSAVVSTVITVIAVGALVAVGNWVMTYVMPLVQSHMK